MFHENVMKDNITMIQEGSYRTNTMFQENVMKDDMTMIQGGSYRTNTMFHENVMKDDIQDKYHVPRERNEG